MLKAIVFDCDGVLVDSEPLHYRAMMEVVRPMGITLDYDQYVEQLIGYDDRDAFRVLLAGIDGAAPDVGPDAYRGDDAAIMRLKDDKAYAFERITRRGFESIPGAVDLVHEASKQMPIAISSGATSHDIALILDGLALSGRFDSIITADDVSRSKPDPQSYTLAVQMLSARHPELQLQARDCLAIEDTTSGIDSALGAGLRTLGVTTTNTAARLRRAHRITDSFVGLNVEQLHRWFDR